MEESPPQTITPDRLPTPWLADSEWLLKELAKARETILCLPLRLNDASDIKSAVDRIWNLEQQLRFLLHLHRQGQHQFAKKAKKVLPKESEREEMQREQERVDVLRSQGKIRADFKTRLERERDAATKRAAGSKIIGIRA